MEGPTRLKHNKQNSCSIRRCTNRCQNVIKHIITSLWYMCINEAKALDGEHDIKYFYYHTDRIIQYLKQENGVPYTANRKKI